ncbi:ABC transporter ATP-binding protein [Bifidobacterium dolichotidis]|uniref:ABC transporter ATP-binding protein n=1 Tax=Bifidobacterium dolichotidis TaxID=2306976 RepID=A0A430FKU8_9BIFI|nr:ATP-binding cassette domain-containing protein [Bifidobacterium dolichotidis]RSX53361.1 ABC transporter ATP-binding protein [Bifidobacterium dolichotidis]
MSERTENEAKQADQMQDQQDQTVEATVENEDLPESIPFTIDFEDDGEVATDESTEVQSVDVPDDAAANNARRTEEMLALGNTEPANTNETVEPTERISARLNHELDETREVAENAVFRANVTYAFKNVTVTSHNRDLLHNVSFGCDAGTSTAILVHADEPDRRMALLATMAGLLYPTEGSVVVRSKNLAELDSQETRGHRLGLMMQQFMLRMDFDAVQNLVYAMDASSRTFLKPKPVLAADLLKELGLDEDKLHVKVSELDVVEQHRVALGRAIACDPDVIIADEPTATLDDSDAEEFLQLLKAQTKSQNKQRAIIVVTSDANVAAQIGNIIELD